jgi:hypothetical protein
MSDEATWRARLAALPADTLVADCAQMLALRDDRIAALTQVAEDEAVLRRQARVALLDVFLDRFDGIEGDQARQ